MIDDFHFISVYGKLPFVVLLEDGMNENGVSISGKDVVISDKKLNVYASFYFKKHRNTNKLPYQKISYDFEDFNGQLTYSSFNMILGGENAKKIKSINENTEGQSLEYLLIDLATRLINNFLAVYKIKTDKPWIPELTRINLSPFKLDVRNSEGKNTFELRVDLRGTGIPANSNIDDKTFKEIKNHCWKGYTIDETFKFMQASIRYKLIGDFKSFVLFLAFYIESWISKEINLVFKSIGKDDQFITDFYITKNGYNKNLNTILKDFLDNVDVYNQLTTSIEYKNYRLELSERRNNLAHGTFIDIDKSQAEQILIATMKYRDYLLANFLNIKYKNSNDANRNSDFR